MEIENRLQGLQYIGKDVHLLVEERKTKGMALHSHDYFELEILLEGDGEMELNAHPYKLTRGSVYFLTPADFHEVSLSKDSRLWNISFDGAVLRPDQLEHLFSCSNAFRRVEPAVLHKLDVTARLLSEESELLRKKLLLEYILRTADIWQEADAPLSPIRRAALYVETFFREDPTLSDVAAHVGFSPSYFGNQFRKEMGETYVTYLNRCKVNCAAMLLKNGRSVTEACFESGFGSLGGFRYVFQQKMKITPKDYAAKYGKAPARGT